MCFQIVISRFENHNKDALDVRMDFLENWSVSRCMVESAERHFDDTQEQRVRPIVFVEANTVFKYRMRKKLLHSRIAPALLLQC